MPEVLLTKDAEGHAMHIKTIPLFDRVGIDAIETGHVAAGHLFFLFDGLTHDQLYGPGVTFELKATDAWYPDTEHMTSADWQPPDKELKTFPGSGIRVKMIYPPNNPEGKVMP